MLETLTPLPADRKCFRMINGVLVERTVSEVLPALQTNADGLKKVLDDLVKQYQSKQTEMEKWKVSLIGTQSCDSQKLNVYAEEEQHSSGTTVREVRYRP